MGKPIKLTRETSISWADSPSDLSNLLDSVMTLICETVGERSNATYQNGVKVRIDKFFSDENNKKSPYIGAYYRSFSNPNLVTLSPDELRCIDEVIQSVSDKNDKISKIRFNELGRTPRNAHVALLKELLFPEFLIKMKEKYEKPVQELLMAALNLVEYMNTPFAILQAEAPEGMVEQWDSLQSEFVSKMGQLLITKISTPSKLLEDTKTAIYDAMRIFQLSFKAAKGEHENQPLNDALVAFKREQLTHSESLHALLDEETSGEFDPEEDFLTRIDRLKYRIEDLEAERIRVSLLVQN